MRRDTLFLTFCLTSAALLMNVSGIFADTTSSDTSATTNVSVTVVPDTSSIDGTPIIPKVTPEDGSSSHNTKPVDVTSPVGIAYYPIAFTGSGLVLNSTNSSSIGMNVSDLSGENTSAIAHIGVVDKTKTIDNWTLHASLTEETLPEGTTITFSDGTVEMNNQGTLKALVNNEVNGVGGTTISKTSTTLLNTTPRIPRLGIYDYHFKNIKLNFANPSTVAAKAYTGVVNWNLAETPV